MQLYLDCDGVLADFNKRWFSLFPHKTQTYYDRDGKKKTWKRVEEIDPLFFEYLQPMPDAFKLYEAVAHYNPVILTGSPTEWGYAQKCRWGAKYFPQAKVIVCKSKEKHLFCKKGDIIIDDRDKYQHLWEAVGGTWILHKTAKDSIAQLETLMVR